MANRNLTLTRAEAKKAADARRKALLAAEDEKRQARIAEKKAFRAVQQKDRAKLREWLVEQRKIEDKEREERIERLLSGKKVQVLSEWETLREIIHNHKSISRYGDGELKHMNGKRNVSQVFCPDLCNRLTEVFYSRLPNHIVAIPNVFNGRSFTEVHENYIVQMKRKFRKIADPSYLYGSSYITRGDLCGYFTWPSYWGMVLMIWEGRRITLVRGNPKRANTQMMRNAKSIYHLEIPQCGAWKDYENILSKCLDRPEDDLFLICAGPTATVLAHDLAIHKRQAVDLGHLGLFYKRNWGEEHDETPQVWHHRPADPGYYPGALY